MHHKQGAVPLKARSTQSRRTVAVSRYSVALPAPLAKQVETYAKTSDVSITKAVAALVRLGLESQEGRKREFFKKLRKNLSINDPKLEDQMVDEFRSLILGR